MHKTHILEPKLNEGIIKVLSIIQPLQVAPRDVHCARPNWRINEEPSITRQVRAILEAWRCSDTYNSSGSRTGEGDLRAFRADCRVVLRSVPYAYVLHNVEHPPTQLLVKHAHRDGAVDADECSDAITVVESSFAGPAERGDGRLTEAFDRV